MAEVHGTVKAILKDGKALVKPEAEQSCKDCPEKHSCSTAQREDSAPVSALNLINAKQGDRVLLYYKSSSVIKLAFLLYILPVIMMIFGAAIGNNIESVKGIKTPYYSVLLSLLFFVLSVFIIRMLSKKIEKSSHYVPKVTKIYKQKTKESCKR